MHPRSRRLRPLAALATVRCCSASTATCRYHRWHRFEIISASSTLPTPEQANTRDRCQSATADQSQLRPRATEHCSPPCSELLRTQSFPPHDGISHSHSRLSHFSESAETREAETLSRHSSRSWAYYITVTYVVLPFATTFRVPVRVAVGLSVRMAFAEGPVAVPYHSTILLVGLGREPRTPAGRLSLGGTRSSEGRVATASQPGDDIDTGAGRDSTQASAAMLSPLVVLLLVLLAVAGTSDAQTDEKWSQKVGDEDDIFKSCGWSTAIGDSPFVKTSVVRNYYPLGNRSQSLDCTNDQKEENNRKHDAGLTCSESPICKRDGRELPSGCEPYENDYTCPTCDGSRMTEHYCARLCTQWFVRKSENDPLQRYGVVAALRKGDQCWCTPNDGARDDTEAEYTGTISGDISQVTPHPCAGDSGTTCGGQLPDGTQVETAVKIHCHSSIRFFVAAVAPVLLRFLFDGLSGLVAYWRLRCHRRCGGRGPAQDQQGFTMKILCGGTHNSWAEAVAMHRQCSCVHPLVVAAYRLLCHASQPIIFLWMLVHYAAQKEMINTMQLILGGVVAGREAAYLLMICYCCCRKPSFLLVDVGASVLGTDRGHRDAMMEGGFFLGVIIGAPEKLVAQVVFQPHGLTSRSSVRRTTLGSVSDLGSRWNNCRYYFTLFAGLALDVCAIVAIVVGARSGQLPWSLSFGYWVSTARVGWMVSVLAWSLWDEFCSRKSKAGGSELQSLMVAR